MLADVLTVLGATLVTAGVALAAGIGEASIVAGALLFLSGRALA